MCWNVIYNFIVVCDLVEMVICYLFDLLVILFYVIGVMLVDLGIGFGLFGIVLVIVVLVCVIILVDFNGKKVCFLCEVICVFKFEGV